MVLWSVPALPSQYKHLWHLSFWQQVALASWRGSDSVASNQLFYVWHHTCLPAFVSQEAYRHHLHSHTVRYGSEQGGCLAVFTNTSQLRWSESAQIMLACSCLWGICLNRRHSSKPAIQVEYLEYLEYDTMHVFVQSLPFNCSCMVATLQAWPSASRAS